MSLQLSDHYSRLSMASVPAERSLSVRHISLLLVLALVAAPVVAAAQQGRFCGTLENGYGPFDYRTTPYHMREVVERAHFTASVRSLTAGSRTVKIGGDIGYTLHAFPNHPQALDAMARLGRKLNTHQPSGARYSVECYFDRAIRFAPDDPQVRILYAHFLVQSRRTPEAKQQLLIAEQTSPTRADLLYNLGLGFVDVGDFDKALDYAHRAYAAGIELSGLRNRLKRVGQWRDASTRP